MQAHLKVCEHNPMAVQLKRVEKVRVGVIYEAQTAPLDPFSHDMLEEIAEQLSDALKPPDMPPLPPSTQDKPIAVTIARAVEVYESMFQQLIERAEEADVPAVAEAIRNGLDWCREELGG